MAKYYNTEEKVKLCWKYCVDNASNLTNAITAFNSCSFDYSNCTLTELYDAIDKVIE